MPLHGYNVVSGHGPFNCFNYAVFNAMRYGSQAITYNIG
jgi:hypothetical protein